MLDTCWICTQEACVELCVFFVWSNYTQYYLILSMIFYILCCDLFRWISYPIYLTLYYVILMNYDEYRRCWFNKTEWYSTIKKHNLDSKASVFYFFPHSRLRVEWWKSIATTELTPMTVRNCPTAPQRSTINIYN